MFSFAVTAFREMSDVGKHGTNILRAIETAGAHDAVSEIVVVDDGSDDAGQLLRHLRDRPKVRVHCNPRNLGVFGNKIEAVAQCREDWVINCDSDNFMGPDFIDRLLKIKLHRKTWYCPSFARPNFDYRELIGIWDLTNIDRLLEKPLALCLINTGNQTVHRATYLEVLDIYRGKRADLMLPNWLDLPEETRSKHKWRLVFDANDSLILNMLWLFAGCSLAVVPGLEYDHYYTSGSDGNYARSPKEKEDLNAILVKELKEASE